MTFDLHPWQYRVVICPGPLYHDSEPALAMRHHDEILIDGTVDGADRFEGLMDQLSRLYQRHHGLFTSDTIGSFVADILRQLAAQGGEQAVYDLSPDLAGLEVRDA